MGSRLRDQALGVVEYLNASISNECASFYPNATENCLMGETHLNGKFTVHCTQLSIRFISARSILDLRHRTTLQVACDVVAAPRARTRKVLNLAENRSSDEFAFHSSACWHHCNTEHSFSTGFLVVSSFSCPDSFSYRNDLRRVMEDCEDIGVVEIARKI